MLLLLKQHNIKSYSRGVVMCNDNTKREQIQRFKEAAKDVGADTSDDALDKIMGRLDLTKKPEADDKKDD